MSASPPPVEAGLALLPAPVRDTLQRSFDDRMLGVPEARLNLDNAFWGGAPETLPAALQALSAQALSIVTRIHERLARIDPSGEAWREVRYLRNVWWGGSGGFKLVYADRARARERLRALFPRVAEDTRLGALEHQRGSLLRALLRPFDADSFREVDRLGEEALHLCVARREPPPTSLDDVHLDWASPVSGVDPATRRCVYAFCSGARHWVQARFGVGAPVFPFAAMEARIAQGLVDPAAAERWRAREWALAASGSAGDREARTWLPR
jgi:hypothetical protein